MDHAHVLQMYRKLILLFSWSYMLLYIQYAQLDDDFGIYKYTFETLNLTQSTMDTVLDSDNFYVMCNFLPPPDRVRLRATSRNIKEVVDGLLKSKSVVTTLKPKQHTLTESNLEALKNSVLCPHIITLLYLISQC